MRPLPHRLAEGQQEPGDDRQCQGVTATFSQGIRPNIMSGGDQGKPLQQSTTGRRSGDRLNAASPPPRTERRPDPCWPERGRQTWPGPPAADRRSGRVLWVHRDALIFIGDGEWKGHGLNEQRPDTTPAVRKAAVGLAGTSRSLGGGSDGAVQSARTQGTRPHASQQANLRARSQWLISLAP